ncbi:hypothetical protein TRVL_05988 [Trypanosoma vivax]|nr:hypothetical protein TRVL_05988 [Trypanosoma vivax]
MWCGVCGQGHLPGECEVHHCKRREDHVSQSPCFATRRSPPAECWPGTLHRLPTGGNDAVLRPCSSLLCSLTVLIYLFSTFFAGFCPTFNTHRLSFFFRLPPAQSSKLALTYEALALHPKVSALWFVDGYR